MIFDRAEPVGSADVDSFHTAPPELGSPSVVSTGDDSDENDDEPRTPSFAGRHLPHASDEKYDRVSVYGAEWRARAAAGEYLAPDEQREHELDLAWERDNPWKKSALEALVGKRVMVVRDLHTAEGGRIPEGALIHVRYRFRDRLLGESNTHGRLLLRLEWLVLAKERPHAPSVSEGLGPCLGGTSVDASALERALSGVFPT